MSKSILWIFNISFIPLLISNFAYANITEDILRVQQDIADLQRDVYKLQNPKVPIGTVVAFASDKIPDGWLLCDGQQIRRQNYAALFYVIGTTHGEGDGSTTFNIPDYRGVFLRGVAKLKSNSTDLDAENRIAMNKGGNTGNKIGSLQLDSLKEHNHETGNLKNSESNLRINGYAYPETRYRNFKTADGDGAHSHTYTAPGSYRDAAWATGAPKFFQDPKINSTGGSGEHTHNVNVTFPDYKLSFWQSTALPQTISGSTASSGEQETRPKNAYVNYIIKF